MEDMEMESECYTVCYCVIEEEERLDPTISAVKAHSSATSDDIPVGTPLGDVITRIKQDKGMSDVSWLHTRDSLWKNLTDKHLALRLPEGAILYLKFMAKVAPGVRIGGSGSVKTPPAACNLWKKIRSLEPEEYKAGELIKFDEFDYLKSYHFHPGGFLYIRSSFALTYDDLTASLERGCTLVRLCGIPGVGKSIYIWYFIIRLAHSEAYKSWDIVYDSQGYYFVFKSNGEVHLYSDDTDPGLHGLLESKTCFHLINQKYEGGKRPLGHQVFLFASPDSANLRPGTKEGMAQDTIYMEGWPYEEFCALGCRLGKDKDHIDQVWKLTQGVPRVLLEIPLDSAKIWLSEAILRTDFQAAKELIGRDKSAPSASFCLMKYTIVKGTRSRNVEVDFASKTVAYMFFQQCMERERDKLLDFLKASAGLTDRAAMRGFLFEQYALSWMTEKRAKLKRRRLGGNGGYTERLSLINRSLRLYARIEEMVEAGEEALKYIWRPDKPNNAGFDAIAPPWHMFDFTVSREKHHINHDGFVKGAKALEQLQEIRGLGRHKIEYTWIGPEDTLGFPKQAFVKKKKQVEGGEMDEICKRMAQYHCIISLSDRNAGIEVGVGEEMDIVQVEDVDDAPECIYVDVDDEEETEMVAKGKAEGQVEAMVIQEYEQKNRRPRVDFEAEGH